MKLTAREKEIIEALQKEPLISQDELATRFGISRSSVAVHISNLMKKGIILGKGYVFSQKAAVVVVGQVGLEIRVREEGDSTSIDLEHAGFGLEMCRNLASFGVNPKLVTVIGNDELGHNILDKLAALDTDINNIYRHPHKRTRKQIICDSSPLWSEGYSLPEFQQAVADREWILTNCDYLIVEPSYRDFVARHITARQEKRPCMCGSWIYCTEMPAGLEHCDLVVIGVEDYRDYDLYIEKARELTAGETKDCIVTDGRNSMILISEGEAKDYPLLPSQSFDNQKGLQIFLAGLVYGLSAHYPLRQAMRIAAGAAHGVGK